MFNGTLGETITHEFEFTARVGDMVIIELHSNDFVHVKMYKKGLIVDKGIFYKILWDYDVFSYTISEDDV